MWPRIRFDIGWWDLAYGLWACAAARDRDHWQRAVESLWSADGGALACHSVRGGFDLLLSSLALPRGSEVLFSALNVKGMIKIARRHGLVPVPVDLDPDTMGPRPDALRRAIGPRSRVLVVAHLFGCRLDLEAVLSLAEEHELFVVEDCAQAFAGLGYRGHPRANVSAFSFGPLKTASALGGALLQVRDPHVLDAMRELQAAQPAQPRTAQLARVLKFAALKILTTPPVLGAVARAFRLRAAGGSAATGRDYEDTVTDAVRGVARLGGARQQQLRPSAPLLALLRRRLRRFRTEVLVERARTGEKLARALGEAVSRPARKNPLHSYWVFPVLVEDPGAVIAALRARGFDAATLPRSQTVKAPADRPELDPESARSVLARLVILPCHPRMPDSELEREARTLRELAARSPT